MTRISYKPQAKMTVVQGKSPVLLINRVKPKMPSFDYYVFTGFFFNFSPLLQKRNKH